MRSVNDKFGWTKIDWKTILVFVLLVFIGWLNIYAAVYNEALSGGFALSSRYGMQLIWIGISAIAALVILLIDDIYYHLLAYPFYGLMMVVLVATLFVGKGGQWRKVVALIRPRGPSARGVYETRHGTRSGKVYE